MKSFIKNITKYRGLLFELISRDVKLKYRRSVLGMFWTLLNPLLMMIVQYIVFSTLFRFDVPNYPVYLLTGQIMFTFFSEATNLSMNSILSNSSLIRKVYIPKYIFPISKTLFSLVNFFFSLIALIIVLIITHSHITATVLLFPIPIILLLLFGLGVGLFLAAVTVYFRDVMYIYGIILLAWTYFTPIFYPIKILGEFQWLEYFNPMYCYIEYFRELIMGVKVGIDSTVNPTQILAYPLNVLCVFYSVLALSVGLLVFKKLQENFILHI